MKLHRTHSRAVGEGLFVAAVVGIGFQAFHFAEHVAQLLHWFVDPDAPPWISRWAATGANSLSTLGDGSPTAGTELLHLVGNLIFLGGLLALLQLHRRHPPAGGNREWLLLALTIQGLHVLEHVALTTTFLVSGRATSFSTAFGSLSGPALAELRVWFHFGINLMATAAIVTYLATVAGGYQRSRGRTGRRRVPARAS